MERLLRGEALAQHSRSRMTFWPWVTCCTSHFAQSRQPESSVLKDRSPKYRILYPRRASDWISYVLYIIALGRRAVGDLERDPRYPRGGDRDSDVAVTLRTKYKDGGTLGKLPTFAVCFSNILTIVVSLMGTRGGRLRPFRSHSRRRCGGFPVKIELRTQRSAIQER
jgi:hypothetical protein